MMVGFPAVTWNGQHSRGYYRMSVPGRLTLLWSIVLTALVGRSSTLPGLWKRSINTMFHSCRLLSSFRRLPPWVDSPSIFSYLLPNLSAKSLLNEPETRCPLPGERENGLAVFRCWATTLMPRTDGSSSTIKKLSGCGRSLPSISKRNP